MDEIRRQNPSKWSLATRLLAEHRAILGRLAALDGQVPARSVQNIGGDNTRTPKVTEAAQESIAWDLALASREVLVSRLKALSRAEAKIREGTYGRCDECGRPIPAARLRVLPEAVRCVPCAELRTMVG